MRRFVKTIALLVAMVVGVGAQNVEFSQIRGLKGRVFNVIDYGAAGLMTTTTTVGATLAGTAVKLASASTFAVGQGITIAGAGAAGATYVGKITRFAATTATITPATSTAVATGATVGHDDTAALAATTAAADPICGEIFLPAGTYNFSSTWAIPGCVSLIGSGVGASYLNFTGTDQDGLYFTGSKQMVRDFAVTGLITTSTLGYAMHFYRTAYDKVSNVDIVGGFHSGIKSNGSSSLTFDGLKVLNYGVTSPTTAWGWDFTGDVVRHGGVQLVNSFSAGDCAQAVHPGGVRISSADGTLIRDSGTNCNSPGFLISPSDGLSVNIGWVEASYTDRGNSGDGWLIAPTGTGVFHTFFFNENWAVGSKNGNGMHFDSTGCSNTCIYDIQVNDTYVSDNGKHGILTEGVHLTEMSFFRNTVIGSSALSANTYDGIHVTNCEYCKFDSNKIGFGGADTARYGFYDAGVTGLVVSNNYFNGASTAQFYKFANGNSGKYFGNTVYPGGPDIATVNNYPVLASLAFTGQAAAIGTTSFQVAIPAGTYRANAYIHTTTQSAGACTSNVNIQWVYNGATPSANIVLNHSHAVANVADSGSVVLRQDNNVGINYYVSLTGGAACNNVVYDFYPSLERVQ